MRPPYFSNPWNIDENKVLKMQGIVNIAARKQVFA
jgi:hypothetical protein